MSVPHSPQEAVAEAAGSQHEGTTGRNDAGRKDAGRSDAGRSDAIAPASQPGPPNAPKAGGIVSRVRHVLSVLGPGVITGASDDDPSGIGTYSVAGAAVRIRDCLGKSCNLSAIGSRTGSMCPHRAGDRARPGRDDQALFSSLVVICRGVSAGCRQYPQYWGGYSSDGRVHPPGLAGRPHRAGGVA